MKFGVFDHLDRNDLPLREFYAQRLDIVEAYDRGGFGSVRARSDAGAPKRRPVSPNPAAMTGAKPQRSMPAGPQSPDRPS